MLNVVAPHATAGQISVVAPEQPAPPFDGAGLVQVRYLLPVVPQAVTEHDPYALHPPFTCAGAGVDVCVAPPFPPPVPPENEYAGVWDTVFTAVED